ncbi:MAG TPA: hypothetical protein VF240_12155 [Pyrinomonadaceae bacterium]
MAKGEFIVKLDGLDLSTDAEDRIAAAIRAAVMQELAKIDTGGKKAGAGKAGAGGGSGFAAMIHPEWRGMIMARFAKDLFNKGIPNLGVREVRM